VVEESLSQHYESFYEEIEAQNRKFVAVLFKMENATLVFAFEGKRIKLGTLAIAMPQFGGKTYMSSILLGERNVSLTKILAEQISRAFHGIALVSTHFAEIHNADVSSTILKLVKKLLDKSRL